MLYDYECIKCGHSMEVQMKITEDKVVKCPKCKTNMKRLISKSTFVLKGDGWAKDNYGKGGKKEPKKNGTNK